MSDHALKLTEATYRVRDIPLTYNVIQVQNILRDILDRHGCQSAAAQVKSLERAASGANLIATVDISPVPSLLMETHTEWEFEYQSTISDQTGYDGGTLTLDNHFLGMTPLYACGEHEAIASGIDIIALTCLGHNAFDSFKAQEDGYMWLRDALGKRVSKSRVWIYGYEPRMPEEDSEQSMTKVTEAFVSSLAEVVKPSNPASSSEDSTRSSRPFVLIGHSLGGLLVRDAVIHLAETPPARTNVLDFLYVMLFFGVPNKSIPVEYLLAMCQHGPQKYLLQKKSLFQEHIDYRYKRFVTRAELENHKIYCFYETAASPTAIQNDNDKWVIGGAHKVLVNKNSAICFRETDYCQSELIPINKNHADLVRFHRQDDAVESVFEILAQASENAEDIVESRVNHGTFYGMDQNCLSSLAFEDMDYRERSVIPGLPEYGTWLLDLPPYRKWKETPASLLSICGPSGVGKSTLMKSLALLSHRDVKVVTLTFFFSGQGTSLFQTELGMIRSLLHQLITQCPRYTEKLSRLYSSRGDFLGYHGLKWTWSEAELKALLSEILSVVGKHFQVEILIDALDETGERTATDIIMSLRRLTEEAKSHKSRIRTVFSCRYLQSLPKGSELAISVQDHQHPDLRRYIQKSLEHRKKDFTIESIEKLTSSMLEYVNANFLWIELVLDKIFCITDSLPGSSRDLFKMASNLPGDLHALYAQILGSVGETDRKDCIKIFQWITYAARPITLAEIRVALMLNSDSAPATQQELESRREFIQHPEHLRERIRTVSKGLVIIDGPPTKQVLRFIHQSVKDYLTSEGLSHLDKNVSRADHTAHFQLYRSCLQYLRLQDVFEFCQVHCSARGVSISRSEYDLIFPLLDYALGNWTFHAESIKSAEFDGEGIMFQDFDGVSKRTFDTWTRFNDVPTSQHCPSDSTEVTHILAAIGSKSVFSKVDESGSLKIDARDSNGRVPLSWASGNGQLEVVKLLVAMDPHCIDSPDISGRTPLWWAASGGHLHTVELLLDTCKVKMNPQDYQGNTPIREAIRNGHVDVVRLFLARIQKDVKLDHDSGQKLFSHAVHSGHVEVVQLILENVQADVNSCAYDRHSVFMCAIYRYHIEVARLLLDTGRVNVNSVQPYVPTPLILAAASNNIDIVRLLLESGQAEIDLPDSSGRTPLAVAASAGRAEVVKLLLETGKVDVESRDLFGESPLSEAVTGGNAEVVRLLLNTGQVNLQYSGLAQQTALLKAVTRGRTEEMSIILSSPLQSLDISEEYQHKLLWTAALSGQTEAAQLIVEHFSINVNLVDFEKRSTLSYAAEYGNLPLAKYLLSHDNIIVDQTDNDGWTPAMYAFHAGHDGIVAALEDKGANVEGMYGIALWDI